MIKRKRLKGVLGEGNGTPLQHSCLENPVDRGTWWAAVHGVAQSRTRPSDFIFTFHFHALEGNGTPLQCSCLENPRDGGARWAAVSGVAQSRTRLTRLSGGGGGGGPGPVGPLAVASASGAAAVGCCPVSAPPTPMTRSSDWPTEHRSLVFGDKVLFPMLVPTSCVQAAPGTLAAAGHQVGVGRLLLC